MCNEKAFSISVCALKRPGTLTVPDVMWLCIICCPPEANSCCNLRHNKCRDSDDRSERNKSSLEDAEEVGDRAGDARDVGADPPCNNK